MSPDESVARVYFGRPLIGEPERLAVDEALQRSQLTNGGLVAQFEERFQEMTGGSAVAVSSCTAALHLAAMALFRPGDEVVVPALTHVATAHAVEAMGAKPVFCDVGYTGNVTPETVSAVLTERTRGLMVLHYLGRPADMAGLKMLAEKKNLKIVEDCALALGAEYNGTHVGLLGDAGCFSFYPAKHMTTCEGGMVLTRNPVLAEEIRVRRRFGQAERMGDVTMLGLNYRMTEIQAAIGIEQLKNLPLWARRRRWNMEALVASLSEYQGVNAPIGANYGFSLRLPPHAERDETLEWLKRHHVEASCYYPIPLHKLTYYREKYAQGPFPTAEDISSRTICLPVGPHLRKRHMRYMIRNVRECLESVLSGVPVS